MAHRPSRQIPIGRRSTYYEHFLNGRKMRFWKFEIFEKCPGPIFQKPAKNDVLKIPPFVRFYFFKSPQKMVFEKMADLRNFLNIYYAG